MSTIHMVMMDSNMDSKDKRDMLKEIDNVEGVKWTISMSSLVGALCTRIHDSKRCKEYAPKR